MYPARFGTGRDIKPVQVLKRTVAHEETPTAEPYVLPEIGTPTHYVVMFRSESQDTNGTINNTHPALVHVTNPVAVYGNKEDASMMARAYAQVFYECTRRCGAPWATIPAPGLLRHEGELLGWGFLFRARLQMPWPNFVGQAMIWVQEVKNPINPVEGGLLERLVQSTMSGPA